MLPIYLLNFVCEVFVVETLNSLCIRCPVLVTSWFYDGFRMAFPYSMCVSQFSYLICQWATFGPVSPSLTAIQPCLFIVVLCMSAFMLPELGNCAKHHVT